MYKMEPQAVFDRAATELHWRLRPRLSRDLRKNPAAVGIVLRGCFHGNNLFSSVFTHLVRPIEPAKAAGSAPPAGLHLSGGSSMFIWQCLARTAPFEHAYTLLHDLPPHFFA